MSLEKILVCLLDALFQASASAIIIFKLIGEQKNSNKLKFFILMYLYLIICFLFIPNHLRIVIYTFFTSIAIYFVLKISDKKILLYSFSSGIIVSISEIVISIILVLVGISSEKLVNDDLYNLIANLFISLTAIVIINIKFVYLAIVKILNLFDTKKQLVKYFYVFILLIYLVSLKNGFEFLKESNYYVNTLFVISSVIVLIIILKSEIKYDQITNENKQMLNYVTKYEKIITEQGKANHEFKNQLMVIRCYAQTNSSKLIGYIDSIVDDIKKTHSSYLVSNLNKFPDGGIKGLLYYKLSVMEDENIKYDINVEVGIKSKLKNLDILMYKNITKILGVLLDNAIDASKKSENRKIIIEVVKENEYIKFKLSNTYKGRIDVSKVGTGYTTKGNGHGFGLKLVQDIINENNQLNIERYLEDNYFVSVLNIRIL